jgi:hypothetical protein
MSKTREVFRQNTTKMISKGKGRNSDDTIKVACEGELEKSMSFSVTNQNYGILSAELSLRKLKHTSEPVY